MAKGDPINFETRRPNVEVECVRVERGDPREIYGRVLWTTAVSFKCTLSMGRPHFGRETKVPAKGGVEGVV